MVGSVVLLSRFFGSDLRVLVLDFFLTHRELDFGVTDVAEDVGCSRQSLYKIFDALLADGLIVKSRVLGNKSFYKINSEDPEVVLLMGFFDKVLMND